MQRRKMDFFGGIFLLFLLLCAIVGCIQHPGTISSIEIIDGDTFRLANGDTVRLIGIDAPESSHSFAIPDVGKG